MLYGEGFKLAAPPWPAGMVQDFHNLMIHTDCEVCGVESVGRGRYTNRYANFSKWQRKIKMADLVLMLRCIQSDTVYMYVQICVDGKLYVEVIKP